MVDPAGQMEAQELIREALDLFPAELRPLHFTDPTHCEECRDHDGALQAHTRENIPHEVLGNPAWDPICFVNENGFKYYFPALVRLAVEGAGEQYYIDQFLFHVSQSPHMEAFNKKEAAFVVKVLVFLLDHRTKEMEHNLDTDELLLTLERWGHGGSQGG